jgi:hypothetical protein
VQQLLEGGADVESTSSVSYLCSLLFPITFSYCALRPLLFSSSMLGWLHTSAHALAVPYALLSHLPLMLGLRYTYVYSLIVPYAL